VSGKDGETRQPIYPVVLLVVLSIHSIIAGIALGLEAEVATSVLVMLAILFHKGSAAFALMVSAYASGAEKRRLRAILTIFVMMTPLGILLGTGASSLLEGRVAVLLEGSFNALAAGTFIYVAILDVINAEMSRRDDRIAHFVRSTWIGEDDVPMPSQDTDRLFKFVLILVGLTCMAVLGIWM
jgi:zinc transporter 1/2/3